MSRQSRQRYETTLGLTAGWLFADLLLALGMLFLVSNTVALPPRPKLTPAVTPTPTSMDRILEYNYCPIPLTVDNLSSFLSDQGSAINQLEPKINQISFLKNRKVGIIIAYGGASDGNFDRGRQLASRVYDVIRDLGNKEEIFRATSYFDPLFDPSKAPNVVIMDVYLVARPTLSQDTCNGNSSS
ncbi:MAG TPA: hypothetical protein VGL94_17195 [Ktedonobacteraceae bacterium]|jgi:hypothetical protein